jgi:hypothetical protein
MKAAVKDGRTVGRNGPPPYLESNEFSEFIATVVKETLIFHVLKISDVVKIVYV